MLVINAPAFFSFSWKLIKNFIDPRTASRIQLFSSKEKGQKALEKLVDKDTEIPADFGGGNISLREAFLKECTDPLIVRQEIELIYCKRRTKKAIQTAWTLQENETMEITVYTRSVSEADINIIWNDNCNGDGTNPTIINTVQAQCRFGNGDDDTDEMPYPNRITALNSNQLVGPGEVTVEAKDLDSTISRHNHGKSRGYYLVVGDVKKVVVAGVGADADADAGATTSAAVLVEEGASASKGESSSNKRVNTDDDAVIGIDTDNTKKNNKPPNGVSVTMTGSSAPTPKKGYRIRRKKAKQ